MKYLEEQLSELVRRVFPIYLLCPENLRLLTEEVQKVLFNTISIESAVGAFQIRGSLISYLAC